MVASACKRQRLYLPLTRLHKQCSFDIHSSGKFVEAKQKDFFACPSFVQLDLLWPLR